MNKHNIDFVIPLCNHNIIFRTVIEAIDSFYKPNKIYIITNKKSIDEIKKVMCFWKITTILDLLDEDTFFVENHGLYKTDIEKMYVYKNILSREFGWWFQQIIKLGALNQIPSLSDPFMIWDADLIPMIKWEIQKIKDTENNDENDHYYTFAILQENSKNEFNKQQYASSIYELVGLEAVEPDIGTFVPHHFLFHHCVIQQLLQHIENHNIIDTSTNYKGWIEKIMNLSGKYYRFSEYKCVATFMNIFYKELFLYHPFNKYGQSGIRYRDSRDLIPRVISEYYYSDNEDISYLDFTKFVEKHYSEKPSYIQIEDI